MNFRGAFLHVFKYAHTGHLKAVILLLSTSSVMDSFMRIIITNSKNNEQNLQCSQDTLRRLGQQPPSWESLGSTNAPDVFPYHCQRNGFSWYHSSIFGVPFHGFSILVSRGTRQSLVQTPTEPNYIIPPIQDFHYEQIFYSQNALTLNCYVNKCPYIKGWNCTLRHRQQTYT